MHRSGQPGPHVVMSEDETTVPISVGENPFKTFLAILRVASKALAALLQLR